MSEPINSEQLFRELTDIKVRLEAGFLGVHTRQDVANGRTSKLEGKVNIMWLLWTSLGAIGLAVINHFIQLI